MTEDDSQLEGLYRFLSNPRVDSAAIWESHFSATAKRATEAKDLLVIHDSSEFVFPGEARRSGLGLTSSRAQGFMGHFALAVSGIDAPIPLGLLGVKTIFRDSFSYRDKGQSGYDDPKKESRRWPELVQASAKRLQGTSARVVHVMDREGDWFEFLKGMADDGHSFVVRLAHDRVLSDPADERISEVMSQAEVVATRTFHVSRRKAKRMPRTQKNHGAREEREATVGVSVQTVAFRAPERPARHGIREPLAVQIVHLRELDPPDGELPVVWTLVTNLPVADSSAALEIVDIYRRRWIIEEFFKALKTGCGFEKRQLENRRALLNALAILGPIAWQMLALRELSSANPNAPATTVLTNLQLQVLASLRRKPLPKDVTVDQALYAIAGLGGHLKNNGRPGWLTLGRGFDKLAFAEQVWRAAREDTINP